MAGLEAISEAMNKNGDYDLRRASIQKLNNFLNEFKQK